MVFNIDVHNAGPSEALDVDVKELLPPGLTLESLSTSQGACAGQICQIGSLPVSNTVTITAETTVDQDVADGSVICNEAEAFHDTPDADPSNNRDQACVTVRRLSDLGITKSADQTVVVGDNLIYLLVIDNAGPSDAVDVEVNDFLPAGTTYVSDSDSCVLVNANQLRCNPGDLAVGAQTSFKIVVNVDDSASDVLFNQASVVGGGLPDPNPGNNTDDASTTVLRPHLFADKDWSLHVDADNSGTTTPGDTLLYKIIIHNDGAGVARNMMYSDTPDPKVDLVEGSVTTTHGNVTVGNFPGDTSILVDVGDLAANDGVIIYYKVVIDPDLSGDSTTVINQGLVSGSNFENLVTNDPNTSTPNRSHCGADRSESQSWAWLCDSSQNR